MEQKKKEAYEPPKATLVPLELEERLLSCNKTTVDLVDCAVPNFGS